MPPRKASNSITQIRDKARLADFLTRQPALNAYPLGDLDERYWPKTTWFALQAGGEIREITLLYEGMDPPILIGIPNHSSGEMAELLNAIQSELPPRIYAHLTMNLWDAMDQYVQADKPEPHHIMELQDHEAHKTLDSQAVFQLEPTHFDEALDLFDTAYPGHWFRREMLGFGPYCGYRDQQGKLLAAGGVHVYSEQYRVATIGNVVTHPDARGRGLATKINVWLLETLTAKVDTIGLNVHAENAAAVRVYEKLGFRKIADYYEMNLVRA